MNRQQDIPDPLFQPDAFRGQGIGRSLQGQAFATKLAQRCNGFSCPEASVAMQGQKQEQRVFEATRRLKLSPRKAKWPDRLVLCIAIHFI
ncbi:hypothetical protein HU147_16260 [Planomicrobium chinense]|uniref:hypothetical protein n=1 Tax=Planococcus chinensis TaxID=272917 RepID=UPI001CC470FA|nr:hypothetical protein [Planococcus chinensis]MBZ5202761.1 hypothetical protein [Planococcus chinensis]